jgi:hypothetical protein
VHGAVLVDQSAVAELAAAVMASVLYHPWSQRRPMSKPVRDARAHRGRPGRGGGDRGEVHGAVAVDQGAAAVISARCTGAVAVEVPPARMPVLTPRRPDAAVIEHKSFRQGSRPRVP